MNEDVIVPWLLQRSTILTALLAGLAPAMVANFKRRSMMPWYVYGFACTLVAWPLITLPTIHAFLLRPRTLSPEARRKQRRADALALLAESSVRSYPTWIAELRRKSPEGVDRRRSRRLDRASRSNSFANLPISATSMPWHIGIAASTSGTCRRNMIGSPPLSTPDVGWSRS